MQYFIDESGVFANPSAQSIALSAVAVLGVPSSKMGRVFQDYVDLRRSWIGVSESTELKGSKLSESQVVQVLDLLAECQCRLWPGVIDLGACSEADIRHARRSQARGVLGNFETLKYPDMRSHVIAVAKTILRMSNSAYAQLAVTIDLIEVSLRECLVHDALYSPSELGELHWTLDTKRNAALESREFIETVVCGALQSRSLKRPITQVKQGNYEAMKDAMGIHSECPPHLSRGAKGSQEPWEYFDIGQLFRRHLVFEESFLSVGLQLADICANVTARAVKGNIQREAWQCLAPLLFRRAGGAVRVLEVEPHAGRSPSSSLESRSYYPVLHRLAASARPLILDRSGNRSQ